MAFRRRAAALRWARAAIRGPLLLAIASLLPVSALAQRSLAPRIEAALAAGRTQDARAAADSALRARDRQDRARPLAVAAFADSLGLLFFNAGTAEALEAAEPYFERALALREKTLGARDLTVAQNVSTLATLNDYLGRFERALELERRALAIRADTLDAADPRIAASHRQIGSLLFYSGRYEEAEASLARALAALEAAPTPDAGALADALNSAGEIARVRDRYADAERSFLRGLGVADSASSVNGRVRAALVNNLAGLYKDLARYDDAEPLLERSLELRRREERPDPDALATAELNRGEVLRLQGRLAEAAPCYARALELSRVARGAGHVDRIPIVNQAATLAAALGQFARAESLFREAEGIALDRLGPAHPLLAQTLHDYAGLLESRGRFAAAESTYTRALASRERIFGGDHPEAAVTRALLARCLASDPARGDAAAAPHLARALGVLEKSPWFPEATLEALALRARMTARAGDQGGAIRQMRAALARVDLLRARRGGGSATRSEFFSGQLALFDDLIGWQLDAGDVAGAFESHERARARTLLDQIAGSGVDFRAGIPGAELAALDLDAEGAERRLGQAQRQLEVARMTTEGEAAARLTAIARLEASRDSAAWDLQLARERIKDRSPLWRRLLSADGQVSPLAEIQRTLVPRGSALLAYHVGERRSWVFVIPPRGHAASAAVLELDPPSAARFGLPPGSLTAGALEQIVLGNPAARDPNGRIGMAGELSGRERLDVARPFASGPDRRELRLHALWRTLVPEPVWNAVRRAEEVAVLPDGALHLLPFEALVVAPRDPGHDTRYWLDQGPAITYGASATSMLALARRPARSSARSGPIALSVSDPDFGPRGQAVEAGRGADLTALPTAAREPAWKPLPATRLESERLVRALAPESVLVLSGSRASEPLVREALAGRRIVHLATHGFVTETRGDLLAGLVLAPPAAPLGTRDDGRLQLYEIYELPLDCDLAVLSACETHRGPRVAGEGVYALSRGFLAAGARRVVASLWPVEDTATAALMGAAFEGIAADLRRRRDLEVARRLRDARRVVRSDPRWADPSFWSAFVLSGAR